MWILELPAKPDREPVENLSDGDKTDPKAKPAEAAKARDEVQPGHLGGSLVLWVDTEIDDLK